MDEFNGIVMLRNYGKVVVKLSEVLDKKQMTRNRLRTLTGIKYEVIDRYYKAKEVEMMDLDFIAQER